jgi:hypothetical protein
MTKIFLVERFGNDEELFMNIAQGFESKNEFLA